MLRWSLATSNLWTWSLYRRLPGAGMVGCGCSRVVPQVSIFPSQSVAILAWLTYDILRCDANPKNLDADGANPRWQGKTNFLINTWDPGILWSDFGVRLDVLVHFLFCFHHSLSSHSSTRSHSLTTSPGLIYMNYYPLTYYIKSSKGLLKITSLNGSTNTWF